MIMVGMCTTSDIVKLVYDVEFIFSLVETCALLGKSLPVLGGTYELFGDNRGV